MGSELCLRDSLLFKVANQDFDLSSIDIFDLSLPEGRNQKIDFDGRYVFIDFAHTPDALKTAILNVRKEYPISKISLVFGCGGERDKHKRPEMGMIAKKYCDRLIGLSEGEVVFDGKPDQLTTDIAKKLYDLDDE